MSKFIFYPMETLEIKRLSNSLGNYGGYRRKIQLILRHLLWRDPCVNLFHFVAVFLRATILMIIRKHTDIHLVNCRPTNVLPILSAGYTSNSPPTTQVVKISTDDNETARTRARTRTRARAHTHTRVHTHYFKKRFATFLYK